MSVALRHYERKDYTYLLREFKGSAKPAENRYVPQITATLSQDILYKMCGKNGALYKKANLFFRHLSVSESILFRFLTEKDPVISAACYDRIDIEIGQNDWSITVSEKYIQIIQRFYYIQPDGKKYYQKSLETHFAESGDDALLYLLSVTTGLPSCKGKTNRNYGSKSCPTEEEMRLQIKRAAAMDDTRIWFVRNRDSGIVHDKGCRLVENIPLRAFEGLNMYSKDDCLCEECRRASLIKPAIDGKASQVYAYVRFFDSAGVTTAVLEKLLDNGAILRFEPLDPNLLHVRVNEDNWQLERLQNQKFILWHNNYRIKEDESREFFNDFHIQSRYISCAHAINLMCDYSWEEHLKSIHAVEAYAAVQDTLPEPEPAPETGEVKRSTLRNFILRLIHSVRGFFQKKR